MKQRTHCPLCGQPSGVIFHRPYSLPALRELVARPDCEALLAGKDYEIRGCAVCDLCFQTWVLDEAEAVAYYSPGSGGVDFAAEIGRHRVHEFAHLVEEILVFRQLCATRLPQVLDFGCNWGKWASVALALGCQVSGVEINPAAAEFCRRRGIQMLGPEQLREFQFEFINVDQVLEHLAAPLEVARQLSGALKPGGFLRLATPGNLQLPRLLAHAQRTGDGAVLVPAALDALYPLAHVNLFTNRSLRALGQAVGLEAFSVPWLKSLGAAQLWNIPRQFNRNLLTPFRRWRRRGTCLWFRKPLLPAA